MNRNRDLDAGIPPVSVGEIAKDDPLVLPAVGQPSSAAGRILRHRSSGAENCLPGRKAPGGCSLRVVKQILNQAVQNKPSDAPPTAHFFLFLVAAVPIRIFWKSLVKTPRYTASGSFRNLSPARMIEVNASTSPDLASTNAM
jgi:hypothetical protein